MPCSQDGTHAKGSGSRAPGTAVCRGMSPGSRVPVCSTEELVIGWQYTTTVGVAFFGCPFSTLGVMDTMWWTDPHLSPSQSPVRALIISFPSQTWTLRGSRVVGETQHEATSRSFCS
jgi:hypothetical protein